MLWFIAGEGVSRKIVEASAAMKELVDRLRHEVQSKAGQELVDKLNHEIQLLVRVKGEKPESGDNS